MVKRLCQAYGIELLRFEDYKGGFYYSVNDYLGDYSISFDSYADAVKEFEEIVKESIASCPHKLITSVIYRREMEINIK